MTNAFTMIFTSSRDLPETSVALVPWLWLLVRTCALPRFARVLRERAAVSLLTRMFSVTILTSALYVLSSLQNQTSSQIFGRQKVFNRAQELEMPLC